MLFVLVVQMSKAIYLFMENQIGRKLTKFRLSGGITFSYLRIENLRKKSHNMFFC